MSELPGLHTRTLGRSLIVLDEVDSTNTYLKERAPALAHGTAVIAHAQTGGKGRLGRSWAVPRGESLSLSLLLHDVPLERLTTLPLITALAVHDALRSVCDAPFAIKWSNDVLCTEEKICGILCESRIAGDSRFVVVGIGVNVLQTREQFERLGLVYATSLFLATQKKFEILPIAAAIVNEMERFVDATAENGFPAVRAEYRQRCVTLGREVQVLQGGAPRCGRALDVLDDGSLLCELDGERVPILAGEASVRGLLGYV